MGSSTSVFSQNSLKMGMKIDRKFSNICLTPQCWAARPRHPKTRVTPPPPPRDLVFIIKCLYASSASLSLLSLSLIVTRSLFHVTLLLNLYSCRYHLLIKLPASFSYTILLYTTLQKHEISFYPNFQQARMD